MNEYGLEPVKFDCYLTYKCPECGIESDMMRLSEARMLRAYICWQCNHQTDLRLIDGMKPVYEDGKTLVDVVPKGRHRFKPTHLKSDQIKDAISIVGEYSDKAESLVLKTLFINDNESVEDLVQQTLASIKDE